MSVSMSVHIKTFKPADDKWRKMKAVWDSCEEAGIDIPALVYGYFNGQSPDPNGVEDDCCSGDDSHLPDWATHFESESEGAPKRGFEIDLSKLQPDVSILKFYCEWG